MLSKAGYGRPDEILNMATDLVLAAVEYERFRQDFDEESYYLNRPEGR